MKKIIALTLVIALIITMVGCSANDYTPADNSLNNNSTDTTRLLLGTSSAGGTYYVLGGGWAKIMNDNIDRVVGGKSSGI